MSLLPPRAPHLIEIVEPDPAHCPRASLPPEGNVKHRNYRQLSDNIRAYTPTGDIHTSPEKNKLVSRFDVCANISPPRAKILELLRPEDPGREALEAIVRPAPRRGLARPLDDDTRRFLQRALLSPSPQGLSLANTPEPHGQYGHSPAPPEPKDEHPDHRERSPDVRDEYVHRLECPELRVESPDDGSNCSPSSGTARSLAEELREAELGAFGGWRSPSSGWCDESGSAEERERLGRLALAVEEEEAVGELPAAARRLDALLAESRMLHEQLARIQDDMQVLARRLAPLPRRWYPRIACRHAWTLPRSISFNFFSLRTHRWSLVSVASKCYCLRDKARSRVTINNAR